MPNEFEKQVQQKMEELKLVPSEPVWQKVEEQIRKKKDRKKFILGIPFLALLLGGGLWIGMEQYSNKVVSHNGNNEIQKENSVSVPSKIANETGTKITEQTIQDHNETATPTISQKKNDIELTNPKNGSSSFRSKLAIKKEPSFEIKTSKENLVPEKKETSTNKNRTTVPETKLPEETVQSPVEKKSPTDAVPKNVHTTDSLHLTSATKEKVEANISKPDSAKHDTASIKKSEIKKHAESKWKYNLIVAPGLSGFNRLNLFNGQKSLAASPAYNSGGLSSGGSQYYGPSEVKKGISFSIGGLIKNELGKRTSFSTGLQYNYYSNTIQVGNRVFQNRTIMDFSVAQYYSNAGPSLQPYHNHYHFISLPAAIDWQLLKTVPLNFHTGLSLQYLIQTNALRFDYNSQTYFHNIKAFNRAQLFSEFGFTYSVPLKQKPLEFGPQLQYGLTRLEKGNSTNHLFSYGLTAQWQLRKK